MSRSKAYRRVSCFWSACWQFSMWKRKFRRVQHSEQIIVEKRFFFPMFPIPAVRQYLQPVYFLNSLERNFGTSCFHCHRSNQKKKSKNGTSIFESESTGLPNSCTGWLRCALGCGPGCQEAEGRRHGPKVLYCRRPKWWRSRSQVKWKPGPSIRQLCLFLVMRILEVYDPELGKQMLL